MHESKLPELIRLINEVFPQEDGCYTNAVFFHHGPDGQLKTMSPLISGDPEPITVKLLAERLLIYSDGCRSMGEKFVKDNLPAN